MESLFRGVHVNTFRIVGQGEECADATGYNIALNQYSSISIPHIINLQPHPSPCGALEVTSTSEHGERDHSEVKVGRNKT